MKVKEVIVSDNNVVVKSAERVVAVTKNSKGVNVIHTKGLTHLVGKESAVKSFLSENDLVKNSIMGLSDEAILDLTFALNQYVEEVLGVVVVEN